MRWFGFATVTALTLLFQLQTPAANPAHPKDQKAEPRFTADEIALYEKQVAPILKANCLKCHGDEKIKSGLSLLSREEILKGGSRGPAVALDKPETSLLLKAISHDEKLKMPESGKLKKEEIDVLTRWVKAGLPVPADKLLAKKEPEPKGGVVTPESKNYWAYKPVQRPDPPLVKNKDWVNKPIDAFVLAKLEAKGLTPTGPADRIALIRRVYYDLTGLPPKPEDVDAFVKDTDVRAYEKLLDKLLDSPQYGEKWGRHWLDLVHFAETNGYERDGPKPYAWRYRDYVIKSFNDDKPYPQFIREQLAGDEIEGHNPDSIIATGFYRLGLWDDEPVDIKQARYDYLDDVVGTTSQVFFGMTMNCARCHNHKIDPIPQRDYYRMVAFFQDIREFSDTRNTSSKFNLTDVSPPAEREKYEKEMKERDGRKAELAKAMTKIEDEAIKKMSAEDQRATEGPDRAKVLARKLKEHLTAEQEKEYVKLKSELDELKKKPEPKREMALSVNHCTVRPSPTSILLRGNPHSPGDKVEPAFPEVLGHAAPRLPEPAKDARTSGRRTILAEWIASKDNQLTARVMMNRVWQFHFGRGIVASANDFGKFGTLPTHPELLDWLASEFMAGDWKLKRMHKLIMTSNAYLMSSKANVEAMKVDPENTLLWRFNMRRLTAEEVRDSILSASGKLNLKMAGPSVYPAIPKEVLAGQSVPGEGWGKSSPEEASRRSVYVYVKRSLLLPILNHHDSPDPDSSCAVRYTTTVPTQALAMLNSAFTNEQAAAFAERLRKEAPNDVDAQVRRAIRLTTSRNPTNEEVKRDVEFINRMRDKQKLSEPDALKTYCLLMLNANEFIYVD